MSTRTRTHTHRVVKVDAAIRAGGDTGGGGSGGGGEDVWTQEQQRQLEAGLVKHPASMDKNERWKAIAEGVEGKSKKQCIERYRALRAALQQQKKAAAAASAGGASTG